MVRASRNVSSARRGLPDSPDNLVDYIEQAAGSQYSIARGEVFSQYARAAMRQDPGLAVQMAGLLGVGGAQRPRPGSAWAALKAESGPGAAADGIFGSLGEFLRAAWHDRARLRNGQRDDRLEGKVARLRSIQASYGSEVPDAGGFLVPQEWRQEVIGLALQSAIVRPLATVLPSSAPRLNVPVTDATSNVSSVFGGLTASWTEESAAMGESQASFALATLDAKALKMYFNAPNELIRDAGPAWDQFSAQLTAEAVAYFEDVGFLTGEGVGEPMGIINSPCAVQAPKQAGQASGTIVWENIVSCYARMLPPSKKRAVWLVCDDAYTELATMALSVGTGGGPIWSATGDLTMFGRPVYSHDCLPQLGTPGDVNFADVSAYLIQDRAVMQADSTPHFKFGNDITSYRIRNRVDGRMALQSAVTGRNNSANTLSVVVQIAQR